MDFGDYLYINNDSMDQKGVRNHEYLKSTDELMYFI